MNQRVRDTATLTLPPASMNVREARDLYLAENGFTTGGLERMRPTS